MVIKNQKPTDFFELTPEELVDYFMQFDIDPSSLKLTGSISDKIEQAAYVFSEHGFNQFTGTQLSAAIYFDTWGNEKTGKGRRANINTSLKKTYEHLKPIKDDLDIPFIEFLRASVGSYKGNLHQIKGYSLKNGIFEKTHNPIFPQLKASNVDWQESITIPLPNKDDFDLARLLGNIWSQANMSGDREIQLYCKNAYKEIMKHKTVPAFQDKFNCQMGDYSDETPKEIRIGDANFDVESCTYRRGSKAICSYLQNMGFSPDSKKVQLPRLNFENPEILDGFIQGLSDYGFYQSGNGKYETLRLDHEKFVTSLVELLRKNGKTIHGPYTENNRKDYTIMIND